MYEVCYLSGETRTRLHLEQARWPKEEWESPPVLEDQLGDQLGAQSASLSVA